MTHYVRGRSFWIGFAIAIVLATAGGAKALTSSSSKSTPPANHRAPLATAAVRAGTDSAKTFRALRTLSVFSHVRTSADVLTPYALAAAKSLTRGEASAAPATRLGALGVTQSRRVLSNQGSTHVDVYVFLNSKGQVCVVYSAIYGSDGCFGSFTPDSPVSYAATDPDQVGAGYPAIVAGLVPSTVASVGVMVNGKEQPATLENGAYFYEPGQTDSVAGVVAHYVDGSTATVGIPQTHAITTPVG